MVQKQKAPSGYVFVDGLGVSDSQHIVLRDRQVLAVDGMLVVIDTVDTKTGHLIQNPDIISRGFVFLKDPVSRVVAFMWVLLPAILGGLFAMIDLIRKYGSNLGRDALLVIGQVVLIASMPMLTWEDPIAILRIGLGLIIAILLWLASFHPRLLPYAALLISIVMRHL